MYKVSRNDTTFTIENDGNRNGCKYQYGSGLTPISFLLDSHWRLVPTTTPERHKSVSATEQKRNVFKNCFQYAETFSRKNLEAKYEQVTDTKEGAGKKAVKKALAEGILRIDELGQYHMNDEGEKDG